MIDTPQDPWAPVRLPRSARARRRFARRLGTGAVAASDAWAWLSRPDLPGPSGATGPLGRLSDARRTLYRQHAPLDAPEHVARLEQRLLTERATARAALDASSSPVRSGGPAAGVVLVALAAAALALSALPGTPRPALDAPSSAGVGEQALPARALRATAEERSRIYRLLDGATAGRGAARALWNRVQSAIDQTADGPYPADGRLQSSAPGLHGGLATGPSTHAVALVPSGAVTIAVTLSRAVPWRARLSGRHGGEVSIAGSALDGRLQYAVLIAGRVRFTRLEIDAPRTVAYSWQILQRT